MKSYIENLIKDINIIREKDKSDIFIISNVIYTEDVENASISLACFLEHLGINAIYVNSDYDGLGIMCRNSILLGVDKDECISLENRRTIYEVVSCINNKKCSFKNLDVNNDSYFINENYTSLSELVCDLWLEFKLEIPLVVGELLINGILSVTDEAISDDTFNRLKQIAKNCKYKIVHSTKNKHKEALDELYTESPDYVSYVSKLIQTKNGFAFIYQQ